MRFNMLGLILGLGFVISSYGQEDVQKLTDKELEAERQELLNKINTIREKYSKAENDISNKPGLELLDRYDYTLAKKRGKSPLPAEYYELRGITQTLSENQMKEVENMLKEKENVRQRAKAELDPLLDRELAIFIELDRRKKKD
jgi:hypothetical protein